ncbi:MOSC domain-containing protein [Halarcobacter bivalviorum]|uniref:MOSC domain-containing protein n=1 Tax=Halarcobacter bivalviorum TaxID=663364 RepID=UPI00100A7511|nr:MOSC domain-containing protein [Halarcobacter bivalviorum]RXK07831.1 MOSC domain-containing protein [Halarcobacter bivalviorum]
MIIGKVIGTFSALKGQSGLPRPTVNSLTLVKDFGIENDKFAGKDLDKTVMIVGFNSYALAKENRINLEYGSLGENILFDFNPHDYKVGTEFKIGQSIIKITENCTICNHLAVFGNELPSLIKDCRGIYCTIVKSGIIKENDSIELLKKG